MERRRRRELPPRHQRLRAAAAAPRPSRGPPHPLPQHRPHLPPIQEPHPPPQRSPWIFIDPPLPPLPIICFPLPPPQLIVFPPSLVVSFHQIVYQPPRTVHRRRAQQPAPTPHQEPAPPSFDVQEPPLHPPPPSATQRLGPQMPADYQTRDLGGDCHDQSCRQQLNVLLDPNGCEAFLELIANGIQMQLKVMSKKQNAAPAPPEADKQDTGKQEAAPTTAAVPVLEASNQLDGSFGPSSSSGLPSSISHRSNQTLCSSGDNNAIESIARTPAAVSEVLVSGDADSSHPSSTTRPHALTFGHSRLDDSDLCFLLTALVISVLPSYKQASV